MLIVLGWLLLSVIVAWLIACLAYSKNRSHVGWFFGSLFASLIFSPLVGILVLLTLGFMPPLPAK